MNDLLGLTASELSAGQMCMRATVVYVVALVMVRLIGNRRFAGKYAAIDIVLSITLGATLSRAIIGAAEFFPTIAAGLTLVGLHWLAAKLAFSVPAVERWTKGKPKVLIEDGQTNYKVLKSASLTKQDLDMVLRSQTGTAHQHQIKRATLEPNGDISIAISTAYNSCDTAEPKASVVDVAVENTIQTVRIVIEQN